MRKFFILLGLLLSINFVEAKDMSITVNIYYTGNNGNARKFAEEMEKSGIATAIRAEKGNLKYEYFYPFNDKETVLLIDIWENQAAVDAHHKTPMMKKIIELRNKYDLHMRVDRYVVDEQRVTEQDKAFIRK